VRAIISNGSKQRTTKDFVRIIIIIIKYENIRVSEVYAPHDIIIIIIVTVTKSYSVYIKYYSKQGEKIMILVRILMSKSGFKDKVLIKLIVGVVKHVTIDII
jgi:hypothetical protein